MRISLLAIRCKDIELSKEFYQKLGLSFAKEQHEDGPVHYSCECNGCVFELYPNEGMPSEDNNRLGFKVSDLANITKILSITDSYIFSGCAVYVLTDPDGRKIEISE